MDELGIGKKRGQGSKMTGRGSVCVKGLGWRESFSSKKQR